MKVTTDNDDDNPAIVTVSDQPDNDPVSFEVKKVDKETGETIQGDANLSGTQFTVKYYNKYYNSKSELPSTATRTWVMQTKKNSNGKYILYFTDQYKVAGDEFYKDANNRPCVPYGTITIEETKAPDGYKISDSTVSVNGQVLNDRTYFTKVSGKDGEQPSKLVSDFTVSDPTKMYAIQVTKNDAELNKSEAIAGKDHKLAEDAATLEGTQFSIINRSANAIKYEGKTINPGEEVTKISTTWNDKEKKYTAQTEDRSLPYGTYGVKEIATSQGYMMSDGNEHTVECHGEDGTTYTANMVEGLNFKNQIIRGNYVFNKKSDEQKNVNAAFKITNAATGESHVVVTDKNGEYDSTAVDHSKNTNANDKLLKDYKKDTVLKASDFDHNSGTWFGQGEDGSMANVDDQKGAFPYGKYEVEELRSDSNKGLQLVKFEFYITKDGKTIQGGTITDESEPKIGTKAKNEETDNNIASATDDVTIIDTVNYEHVAPDKYRLTATLMNKKTGAVVLDKDGKAVTGTKVFTNTTKAGSIDVELNFDASDLGGEDVVVFEVLTRESDGAAIATHQDINDEGQTISFVSIGTKASDANTGSNLVEASTNMKIKDTVSYKNLIVGKTYTINGTLMDKETGKPALDDEGKEITSSVKFTAESKNGTVDVIFEFSGVKLAGKPIVAFESLTYKGKEYAVHQDIEDEDQTTLIPKVSTTASDKTNGTHMSYAGKKVTLVDTVKVENIVEGREYTLKGKVIDKNTGNPLEIDGKEVSAEKKFTATSNSETVELEFEFDGSNLAGTTTVVFEDLYEGENRIGSHADLNDEGQTVSIPKIGTTLVGKDNQIHVVNADQKITLVDTVKYQGLEKGREYEVKGILYDKETKEPFTVNGEQVTATGKFTAETESGTAEVEFTFDGSALAGKTLVAYEEVFDVETGALIADHKDIDDNNQTVVIPKIGTTLTGESNNKAVNAGKETTLIDTVKYENVEPGREIEVQGVLHDKETGEVVKVDGKEITATAKFTPSEANGAAQVTFKFDASSLAGKTLVAYEKAYDVETKSLIGSHEDINDNDQTVNFPELHTTALNKENADHIVEAKKNVTIVDTVSYKNVTPGEELEVKGVLYDKNTKKPVMNNGKEVTASAKFTPETSEGSADVTFTFDASDLDGHTFVAYEQMYDVKTGALIGTHEDINDEDQSVHAPKLHTTATNKKDGSHNVKPSKKVTVVDIVKYTNLVPGKTYEVQGTLYDKATKKPLKINGKKVMASTKFVAKGANGEVKVVFKFDASALDGKSLVAFEQMYDVDTNTLIGRHEDINDKKQTVKVSSKATPHQTSERSGGSGSSESGTPKTGDYTQMMLFAGISACAMVGGYLFYRRRKQNA